MSGQPARLPLRPARQEFADVVIVGSGAAGATAARGTARAGRKVVVVTKSTLGAGSTTWAQGGLAAVLDATDSWQDHVDDTVTAGAGLSDRRVVEQLVRRAPAAVHELIAMGAEFDRELTGDLALAREGGHQRRRIVHAGGDATGAEVQRTLDAALRLAGVAVRERCVAIDVVLDVAGNVAGIVVAHIAENGVLDDVTLIRTTAVVLATGGLGQAYAVTTNPPESTGDGVALAWRAGAEIGDIEFVQFHPTAFWQPSSAGQQLLVSEAVRGEGATLIDGAGRSVMAGVHPMGDLAPRDVVATAIAMRLRQAPGGIDDHVFLDATTIGELPHRFPTIVNRCREAGIDPVSEPIPVAPAAHFSCGGVRAGIDGTSSVAGLFAIGEVADTGIHGANRLASNGVTEGLVMGHGVAVVLGEKLPVSGDPVLGDTSYGVRSASSRASAASGMSRWAGPLRDASGLQAASEQLQAATTSTSLQTFDELVATNLHDVSGLIVRAALMREESRGSHRRLDYDQPADRWLGRILQRLVDGRERTNFQKMAVSE